MQIAITAIQQRKGKCSVCDALDLVVNVYKVRNWILFKVTWWGLLFNPTMSNENLELECLWDW